MIIRRQYDENATVFCSVPGLRLDWGSNLIALDGACRKRAPTLTDLTMLPRYRDRS